MASGGRRGQGAAQGAAQGVRVYDAETGAEMEVFAKVIVNATGPQADAVRHLDNPDLNTIVAPSQGVHIVLDRSFIPRESAIMVPHTDDGRVMFAIPWRDVAVVGTTDTLVDDVPLEPQSGSQEIDFILDTANRYLARPAARSDIKSVFAGIRPLVEGGDEVGTATLSRDHVILIDPNSAMMTVVGGKWTTYRKMAEDVVDTDGNVVITNGTLLDEPAVKAIEDFSKARAWCEANPETANGYLFSKQILQTGL